MKSVKSILMFRSLSVALVGSALAACGAGSDQTQGASAVQSAAMPTSTAGSLVTNVLTGPITTTVSGNTAPGGTSSSTPPASTSAITDVRFENTSATATQNNVPITFGQVFAQGNLKTSDTLTGRLDDGTIVPLQVDVKATHADGSIRHAVISAIVPNIAAGKIRTMLLVKGGTAPKGTVTIDSLMHAGFSTSVHAKIGGTDYYASADELLKSGKVTNWLNGPVATEWQVSAPLRTASGAEHPHLTARFAIRYYSGINKARVDVVVENNWAFEPSPQNFTYDASVMVGGKSVYTKAAMTHYNHARWRKLFWWNGTEPQVNIKENTAYLIASRAVPNYDQSVVVSETTLAGLQGKWAGAVTEPMNVGMAMPYMPTTGAHPDIGLMPGWTVSYLLSMDKRARDATLGTADLAGTWSAHYRDRNTDRPVSILDFPYMTILGRSSDTFNPKTKKYESFPACGGSCTTPFTHDSSHQPNLAYLPYLVTGDYYYLEELQFWASFNSFQSNPGYRQYDKGLLSSDQVRGQAWSMRTAAEVAYITPDKDPLKAGFVKLMENNLDWYNTYYGAGSTTTNQLGVITNGTVFAYNNGLGLAPWQDDFFTSAIGHAADLGFTKANTLLAFKSKFPIERMIGAGACWIDGAIYTMKLHDTTSSSFYTTIAQAYKASHSASFANLQCGSSAMATALGLKVGEMTGYSSEPTGYPSNMQPALAYAATAGGAAGQAAWKQFMARTVKPNYSSAPQFAIVPR